MKKDCGCVITDNNEVIERCKYHDLLGLVRCKWCNHPKMLVQHLGIVLIVICDNCDKIILTVNTKIITYREDSE